MSSYLNGHPIGSVVQTEGVYNIDLRIRGAIVGEVLRVAAVDENGRPTAWETIDSPIADNSITPAKLDREYLQLNMGVVVPKIVLQSGVHYGSSYPANPTEGQLFFVEEG